jgi:hypothetical protein
MKRRVIVESPFTGNIARNIAYARRCVRDAVLRGEAPIAFHLLLTQEGILRDEIPEERATGIAAGQAWFAVADVVAFYIDLGISPGMRAAMDAATATGVVIEIRQLTNKGDRHELGAQHERIGAAGCDRNSRWPLR